MNVNSAGADLPEVYAVSVQKKTLDQEKQQGAQAVKLIESSDPGARPLPPDATFSTKA